MLIQFGVVKDILFAWKSRRIMPPTEMPVGWNNFAMIRVFFAIDQANIRYV
jgi:hypothetical protein